MKTIKYLMLNTILTVCVATAGDKGEQEAWMREAMGKERSRAQESASNHSNIERLEEKFGWAKDKHNEHLVAMISANKNAAEAWKTVLRKVEEETNPDALSEVKQIANSASAEANLAEMTLKYAASAAERKNMIDKTRDRDVSALTLKLNANENALLLAHRAKNEAQVATEKLQIENRKLSNELRKTYEEARKKDEGKNNDRDHDKERKKERDRERPEKERRENEKKDFPRENDEEGGGAGGVIDR